MIRVMTDNAANLPPELREQYGIRELCLTYTVNGVPADMSAPFDGYAYYEAMRKGAEVKTSMISPLTAREAMEPVLEQGDDVLYIGLSGGVSGTCWGVSVVAQELRERYPHRDIRVLDSRGASLGEGLVVLEAAHLAQQGADMDTITARASELCGKMRQLFVVDDLKFLRRGGRLSGAAALAGTVYSSLLAVACINFKADQTLVGTALNLLGTAGATVIVKAINTAANPDDVSSIVQYAGAKKAFTVNLGSFEFSWFMLVTALLLAASYVLLYKTRFGLRLMACGEHPQAADSVGINVYKMRWAGVLISGFLGGIGGIVFITAGVSEWRFEYGVAGFGFLSLAVMIFGQWKPQRIALAALLFGLFRALSNVYMGFGFLTAMNIPSPVYNMMPYIISLIVLAFTSKRSRAPKAEGIPYDKGQR